MQQAAVEHRGSALLISAGAGSGKTTVLIERLMRLVEEGTDIDRFLLITYTRTAAAELKDRLSQAIAARLAVDPGNRHLRRQASLLYRARINTIHAFCGELIREYAAAADVRPDFRQLDASEAEALLAQTLEELLEKHYEELTEDFAALADMLGAGRDDSALSRIVLETWHAVQSHPDPAGWMARQSALLREEKDAGATPWGRLLLQRAARQARYWQGRMEAEVEALREDEDTVTKYLPSWLETIGDLIRLQNALREGWDAAWRFGAVAFPTFGAVKGRKGDPFLEQVKQTREGCKKAVAELLKTFDAPGKELLADMARMRPVIESLYALVNELTEAYAEAKKRRGALDFNDLEHLALRLLTDPETGEPGPRAAEAAGRFAEILVDEYQDVNELQERIFQAVSQGGRNVTMVGDVKQAIYRFRLADPAIFLKKYVSYADWPAPEGVETRILLSHNFRSRPEILDTVNFVFSRLMSPELGEMAYGEAEAMLPGRTDEGAFAEPVEYCFCETPEEADRAEYEAACVAGRIKELLQSGVTLAGEPLRPGDIAILLRSPRRVGDRFRAALEAQGIPASVSGGSAGLFDGFENEYLLSLLRVIDDPMQDIPLLAALRGPVWGFSADELALIRAAGPGDLYTALRLRAEQDGRCADFLAWLSEWREKAAALPADALIRELLAATGLPALAEARQSGAAERLYAVQSYAQTCEAADCRGLYGFLQRVDGAEPPKLEQQAAAGVSIMSVHAAKGLEFPVVLLCDLPRAVNLADSKRPLLIHRELGAGPKLTDTARGIVYPTLSRTAIAAQLNSESLSEDLRVLYVAMTRAREKLICVFSTPNVEAKLAKLRLGLTDPPAPELLEKRANFEDWLLSALLCGPDLSRRLLTPPAAVPVGEAAPAPEPADPALIERLRRSVAWQAPMASQGLPSKVTATALKQGFLAGEAAEEAEEIAPVADGRRDTLRRPRFITGETGLTPAEKGTAIHMAMQLIDFSRVSSAEEIAGELARMRDLRLLTPEQAAAVDPERLLRFFRSPLGRRALAARELRREFKFSLLIPAAEIYGRGEGELLLQGVIDLFFEEEDGLVLVDFKSDRITQAQREARAAEYAGQLTAYGEALQRITGRPVKEKHLFFFACDG